MATTTAGVATKIPTTRKRRASHVERYKQIALVLFKYQMKDISKTLGLQRFLPFGWLPANPFHKETRSEPERARLAIEELGTTFVKVGQILSTRTDLLPAEFTYELSKLQNDLKPFPVEGVYRAIQAELGKPAQEVFATFNPKPIGVASIGQAHSATLPDGTEVVVKVRKPGVVEQVSEDIAILRELAASAAERWKTAQYDIVGIIGEISDTLIREMDYLSESRNAEGFAQFFKGDDRVYIPRIYREFTTPRVITLERLKGIRISDFESLDRAKIDRKDLAKRVVNLWLKMFFEGDFFHADPHPGNLFVQANGSIGLIDFGMIGFVDDEIREHLCEAVKAILERDVDSLIDALIDMGAVRHGASRDLLRAHLKNALTHSRTLSTEDFARSATFNDLIGTIRDNQVQLLSNTFLLLKTMTMVHGMGKALDPELDILQLLEPHIKRILARKYSPGALAGQAPMAALEYAVFGLGLPQRLNRLFRSVERGEFQVRAATDGLEEKLDKTLRVGNRLIFAMVLSAAIIAVAMTVVAFKLGQ